jgi:flavin reductase (DIM6/NTAB) family NADH-FMN oxidoreductase RutF
MTLDPDSFRSVLGRFASGVTVVTARDREGRDHGMTVSAFSSLSLAPPLILICIEHGASMHGVLAETAHFAVNMLSVGQEALSRRFSSPDAHLRFDGVGYTRGQTGTALLDDVLAYLECRLVDRHASGDHTIFIGEVEAALARPERPLLYYRGGYAQLER